MVESQNIIARIVISQLLGYLVLNSFIFFILDQNDFMKNVVACCCCVRELYKNWNETQNLDITQQLQHGIRYFDIRPTYYNLEDDFFTRNRLFGPRVSTILNDIKVFLDNHPKEVVITHFHEFCEFTNSLHTRFADMITSIFEGMLYFPKYRMISSLAAIWDAGKQVIVLYSNKKVTQKHKDFWSHDYINGPLRDDVTKEELFASLDHRLNNIKSNSFNIFQGAMVPPTKAMFGNLQGSLEKDVAKVANETVIQWLGRTYKGLKSGTNILTLDFVENGECVQLILRMNDIFVY